MKSAISISPPEPTSGTTSARIEELFREQQQSIICHTDRLFSWLMVLQWFFAVGIALWLSPLTWSGVNSRIHPHVWTAIFLGGIITGFPVFLARTQPGKTLTRHAIAIGQMLMSALLIHLTGGRIETHFHVFGSLAILAFYRDWRVLMSATVVVTADHLLRAIFWPESAFGVLSTPLWRPLEHAGWVIFEVTFLIIAIRKSIREMYLVAERQAKLEAVNAAVERTVQERTAALEQTHRQLVDASRQAGMAEVATSVLHNVGNVLNSVNVSTLLVADKLQNSKMVNVAKLAELLREHEKDLGNFVTNDPRGRKLPEYLGKLAGNLTFEQENLLAEIASLANNVAHIKEIVAMQQGYAKAAGVLEPLKAVDLVEDALNMNSGATDRHKIKVVREFSDTPAIMTDKHKVLQILINLIRNSKYACDDSGKEDKQITLQVRNGDGRVKISVIDNGVGIPQENLTRIFNHGFTTRKGGHGFGLHSGALAAKELGGTLTAFSEGIGQGATFTLELPANPPKKS